MSGTSRNTNTTMLERGFNLLFAAIAIPALTISGRDQQISDVYDDKILCTFYKNMALLLAVAYHVLSVLISSLSKDWSTVSVLLFCVTLGTSQTFIADHFLCRRGLLQYPLNTTPTFDVLGYCVPEYMVLSWSMFAFIEIKSTMWFCSKGNSVILSAIFGYILIIAMEMATDLPYDVAMIALWKANSSHTVVNLVAGGLASYLIVPECCLSVAVSATYHWYLKPAIDGQAPLRRYTAMCITSSLAITFFYTLSLLLVVG